MTPSRSSRSTRRFTAGTESETRPPMSASVRFPSSRSSARIFRSVSSSGFIVARIVPFLASMLRAGRAGDQTRAMAIAQSQSTREHVRLDGRSLTIEDLLGVARHGRHAAVAPAALERMEASRDLKVDLIAREIPIYGVTTGFGDSAHRQVSPDRAAGLQQSVVRHLGTGTGRIADAEVTRGTMLLRANCLAKGNSGVRTDVVKRLLHLLNHGVLPRIPER